MEKIAKLALLLGALTSGINTPYNAKVYCL